MKLIILDLFFFYLDMISKKDDFLDEIFFIPLYFFFNRAISFHEKSRSSKNRMSHYRGRVLRRSQNTRFRVIYFSLISSDRDRKSELNSIESKGFGPRISIILENSRI